MKTYWWQDKIDDYQQWHSLLVRVNPETVNEDAPALLSGHNSRMQLQLRGYPLFWATVLRDHCGVWLIYNQDHPAQQNLLSPLRSQQTEKIAALPAEEQTPQWCRYFARDLQERPSPLLAAGEWLLHPMNIRPPSAPYVVNAPCSRKNGVSVHRLPTISAMRTGCYTAKTCRICNPWTGYVCGLVVRRLPTAAALRG